METNSLPPITNKSKRVKSPKPIISNSLIIFEVIEEIRRRVEDPSFVVCVKINSVEFQEGGMFEMFSIWQLVEAICYECIADRRSNRY